MSISFTIWNVRPQLIDFGNFEIRYYSLLFALGFVAGYIILSRIFKKKGLKPEIIDKLTIYMVISTIIGARLGHCLFYEFDYYSKHILEIFLPWQGTIGEDFRFTGFQGLASHGAAVGILAGIYFFARKTKMSYLWVMDMIVMVTALAGSMIRTGNLMNSEIYGKPTGTTYGFVFTRDFTDLINEQFDVHIQKISYDKVKNSNSKNGYVPVEMNIRFTRNVTDEQTAVQVADYILKEDLQRYNFDDNIKAPENDSTNYKVENDKKGYYLTATILGMPRHPSQIYEASCYLLIFFLLLFVFYQYDDRLKDGYMFGLFLALVFLSRFFIEFIKENQEAFEDDLTLNMGQILSIPFVLIGIGFIIWRWPKKKTA